MTEDQGGTVERDERVVVVAWRFEPYLCGKDVYGGVQLSFGQPYTTDRNVEPLMTVAQHEALRAADREEIERLKDSAADTIDGLHAELVAAAEANVEQRKTIQRISAERDAALAKLAELEKQEPVGWLVEPLVCVRGDGREDYGRATFATGQPPTTDRSTPLYAQPRPASVVMPEELRQNIQHLRQEVMRENRMPRDQRQKLADRVKSLVDEFARLNAAAQVPEAGGVQGATVACACGSVDHSVGYESPQAYWVGCGDCGYATEKASDRNQAIAAWNSRNAVPQPAAQQAVALASARVGRIYLAGPMTGIEHYNFPAFNAEAARLRAQGFHVENPAEHGIVEGADWADYLRYDIGRLATCERIHLLPGWSKSKGARLEVHIAQSLGMHVWYAEGAEDVPAQPAAQQVPEDVRRLREALEPFAKFIEGTDPAWSDSRRIATLNYDFNYLTLGIFRAAQAALSAQSNEKEG